MTMLLLAALAALQNPFPGMPAGRESGRIVVYRDNPCPRGRENDVVVCTRPLTVAGARALGAYGACLAWRAPAESRALLALPPGEAARAAAARLAAARRDCAPRGRLAFSTLLLQGAIAEALIDGRVPRADRARPLPARDEGDHMSLCVIATAPRAAAALLGSVPGASRERAALAALRPRLDGCLGAGLIARLHPRVLRAMLALAAYRLVENDGGG